MDERLRDYEKEIIVRMFEAGYIFRTYSSLEKVSSTIKWRELSAKYGVRRGFKSVIRRLISLGLVTDHGKSLRVISLTGDGVKMALALKRRENT